MLAFGDPEFDFVAPPPPPAYTRDSVSITTVQTRIGGRDYSHTTVIRGPAQPRTPPSNCARLNESYADARYRLEGAQGRADLAPRPEIARKAQGDMDHIREVAAASDCKVAQ